MVPVYSKKSHYSFRFEEDDVGIEPGTLAWEARCITTIYTNEVNVAICWNLILHNLHGSHDARYDYIFSQLANIMSFIDRFISYDFKWDSHNLIL